MSKRCGACHPTSRTDASTTTRKLCCHPAQWPNGPEVLERVATRSCSKRGAAIDLVLDRGRKNRSQFVITVARGRQMIFWQTARVTKQARPNVATPTARAAGPASLEILVDVHERYAWQFADQQATPCRRPLAASDSLLAHLPTGRLSSLEPPEPTTAEIRAWARDAGMTVPDRGRLRPEILVAYRGSHDPKGN